MPEEKMRRPSKQELQGSAWGWGQNDGNLDMRPSSWIKEAAELRQMLRNSNNELQVTLQDQKREIQGLKRQMEEMRAAEEESLRAQISQVKLTTAELTVKLNSMEELEEDTVRQQIQTIHNLMDTDKEAKLGQAGLRELKEHLRETQAHVHSIGQARHDELHTRQEEFQARADDLKAEAEALRRADLQRQENLTQLRSHLMSLNAEKDKLNKRDLPLLRQELNVIRADVQSKACELRAEMAALREELRREIEVTAIKTGHLALTATSCDIDERRKIYTVLKNREKEISEAVSGITTYSTGKGGSVEYSGMAPLTPGAATLGLSPVLSEFDPNHEFEVKVDASQPPPPNRPKQESLIGAEFDGTDGKVLRILRLKDGLLRTFNRECEPPQIPVNAGDLIVQVNGIRGSASLMEKELQKKVPLTILLLNGGGKQQ